MVSGQFPQCKISYIKIFLNLTVLQSNLKQTFHCIYGQYDYGKWFHSIFYIKHDWIYTFKRKEQPEGSLISMKNLSQFKEPSFWMLKGAQQYMSYQNNVILIQNASVHSINTALQGLKGVSNKVHTFQMCSLLFFILHWFWCSLFSDTNQSLLS